MIRVQEVLTDLKAKGIELSSLTEGQLKRIADMKAKESRLERDGGIHLYSPQSKIIDGTERYQVGFHKSLAKIRWVFGGNRSAKSHSSIAEAVWWATGLHPYRKVPIPNRGWIVSLDFPTSRDVAERLVWELLPKSMILKWDRIHQTILLRNGSEIMFKSCEAGKEKFQGAKLHWIAFDEEPQYDIYQECLTRLIDYRGCMWCAETPTSGMTWTYDEIWEMAGINNGIEVFKFSSYWNNYIPQDELKRMERMYDQETLNMRMNGEFVQLSGLVFKGYNKDVHVIPAFSIPKEWQIFRGIDHGVNNPTACVWVAFNRDGDCYVIDEYYETDKTIKENAEAIRIQTGGMPIRWTAIDGSTKQRLGIENPQSRNKLSYFDEYKNNGIHCKPVWLNTEKVSDSIATIRRMLEISESTKKPKLYIFDTCYNFLKEFSRYRWKSYKHKDDKNVPEKPQEYLNHAITAFQFVLLSGAKWETYEDEADIKPIGWY